MSTNKRETMTLRELWNAMMGVSQNDVLNDQYVIGMLKQVQIMIDEGAFDRPYVVEPISICKMHSSVRVAKMTEGVLFDLKKKGVTIRYLVNLRVGDFPHFLVTGCAENALNALYPNVNQGIGDREMVRFFYIFTELMARYKTVSMLWDDGDSSSVCGWKSKTLCRNIDKFLEFDIEKVDIDCLMDRSAAWVHFDDISFFEGLFSGDWMISHRKGSGLVFCGDSVERKKWVGFLLSPKIVYLNHPEYSLFDWRYFEFGRLDIEQVHDTLVNYGRLKRRTQKMKKKGTSRVSAS